MKPAVRSAVVLFALVASALTPGTGRAWAKATAPGENGVVDLSAGEFLDRLADLVPPPRRHRHRYHGVFAPHHPPACPACGGDIRLIAFITDPAPIRKILLHLGEPLGPPPLAPARGPPTTWDEIVQAHDDRDAIQAAPHDLPVIDIHSL